MCFSALIRADIENLEKEYGAEAVKDIKTHIYTTSITDPAKIFRNHLAPIIYIKDGKRVIENMRYSVYQPSHVRSAREIEPYNARRDKLHSAFWSESFGIHHGIIALVGFSEWVNVRGLVENGFITLEEAKEEFQRLADIRKAKILGQGKKWKPTAKEKEEAITRKIIINFIPKDQSTFTAPVIFCDHPEKGKGFALITDRPTEQVRRAGHHRSPVCLTSDGIDQWLKPQSKNIRDLDKILDLRKINEFRCTLKAA